MTNDEVRRNDEIRMTKPATVPLRDFRHSGFGFLSTFVIRHSTTYAIQVHGPNACAKAKVTLIALRHPELRGQGNVLARQKSLYCSAFVQLLFRKAGIDLAPGVDAKHTTPEDISRAPIPHVTYLLKRGSGRSKLEKLRVRLRRRVRARIKHVKGAAAS
jgi:hypothetical protein